MPRQYTSASTLAGLLSKQTRLLSRFKWVLSIFCLALIAHRLYGAAWGSLWSVLRADTVAWLLPVLCLTVANLALEAVKWQVCLQPLAVFSFRTHVVAVVKGIAMGIPLTHLVGDLAAKLSLVKQRQAEAIPLLMVASLSQYIATATGALFAIYAFSTQDGLAWAAPFKLWLSGYWAILLVGFAALPQIYNLARQVSILATSKLPTKVKWPHTWSVLGISLIRYTVILSQYMCLYHIFAAGSASQLPVFIAGICIALAVKALVPLAAIGGMVGLRELVLLTILSPLGFNPVQIVVVSLSIWLLNVALPGIVGAIFLSRKSAAA